MCYSYFACNCSTSYSYQWIRIYYQKLPAALDSVHPNGVSLDNSKQYSSFRGLSHWKSVNICLFSKALSVKDNRCMFPQKQN